MPHTFFDWQYIARSITWEHFNFRCFRNKETADVFMAFATLKMTVDDPDYTTYYYESEAVKGFINLKPGNILFNSEFVNTTDPTQYLTIVSKIYDADTFWGIVNSVRVK